MTEADPEQCRVVVVEWDRGHDKVDGILRAEGPDGTILTEIYDLIPDAGYCWLRADEILSVDDVCASSGTARSATLRDVRTERLDPELTTLLPLLRRLVDDQATVGIYTRRTGSGELLAGIMASADDASATFREIDPGGTLTGEEIAVELPEIIRINWDTDYLRALRALVDFAPPPPH